MAEVDAHVPKSDVMEGIETTAEQPSEPAEDEYTCETLYIQNLNEKIKPEGSPHIYILLSLMMFAYFFFSKKPIFFFFPVLKTSLRGLFKAYGEVLDVVAHNNLRMRGQAFVSFPSAEMAKKAMKDVQRFPLYSKPMVRAFVNCYLGRQDADVYFILFKQISFARTRSDAVVKRLDGNMFDEHKSKREERKSAPSLHQTVVECSQSTFTLPESTRYTNPLKSKYRTKRLAAEGQLFYIPRLIKRNN